MCASATATTPSAARVGSRPGSRRALDQVARRRRAIQRERTARERVERQAPEHDQRVGERRRAAAAVARRTGVRAGAPRPHREQPARIHARDRAAPGADRVHVENRQQHREARDLAPAPPRQIALDVRAIRRRAADVDRERALEAARARRVTRGAQAAGRPREQLAHRLARRAARRRGAAVREHDLDARRGATRERLEVARDARLEIRVRDRGREALELAQLRTQLGRASDRHAERGEPRAQRRLGAPAGVRMEQADRDRLGREPLHAAREPARGRPAPRVPALAARARALRDADAPLARHERRDAPRRERVEIRPVLPADLDHVLEASRGHEHDARPLALEQRVRRDRGAVRDARAASGPRALQTSQHRELRRARRRGQLERDQLPPALHHEVRERAARVHAHRVGARRSPAFHGPLRRRRRSISSASSTTPTPAASSQSGKRNTCPISASAK